MSVLLELDGVSVRIPVGGELRQVTREVSFSVEPGEALGIVGESGSGKSVTARAITRLLPAGSEVGGRIAFEGRDVSAMDRRELRRMRGSGIGFIFQDPRAHLDPLRRIGSSMVEALVAGGIADRHAGLARAEELLGSVGIDDARRRMRQFPHELSGGMLQRVMIASVLLAEPRLILADEPTTALDVVIQAEIVAILDRARRERGTAVVFITHDLDLAGAVCDRIAVMYAGTVQESRPSGQLLGHPWHPYTRGLLAARPELGRRLPELPVIPGRPAAAFEASVGCAFAARCPYAVAACRTQRPPLEVRTDAFGETGRVRCLRVDEVERETAGRPSSPADGWPAPGAEQPSLTAGGQG